VPAPPPVRHGATSEAGGTFTHDGVTLYYEVIVHFNGGSTAGVGAQIDHLRKGYKVNAMDSRDNGKSCDSPDTLTYEKMTDDLTHPGTGERPATFNGTVERFLRTPFVKPDQSGDAVTSLENRGARSLRRRTHTVCASPFARKCRPPGAEAFTGRREFE